MKHPMDKALKTVLSVVATMAHYTLGSKYSSLSFLLIFTMVLCSLFSFSFFFSNLLLLYFCSLKINKDKFRHLSILKLIGQVRISGLPPLTTTFSNEPSIVLLLNNLNFPFKARYFILHLLLNFFCFVLLIFI